MIFIKKMSQKPILLLVDKRDESNEPSEMQQNSFKNSGFRCTYLFYLAT